MNASMGTGIGKRMCDVYVIDGKGKVLKTGQYQNMPAGAGAGIPITRPGRILANVPIRRI